MDSLRLPSFPIAFLAVTTIVAASCSESTTEPTSGSLTVSLSTTGADLDADGYTVTVGATAQAVGVDGSTTFTGLAEGATSVALSGVADNCAAAESNPQTVMITAGQTATVAFTVTCDALAEAMTLVAADRDGNLYVVDASTGAETLYSTPMTDDGAGGTEMLGVVSSMAWVPSTDRWWLGLGGNSVCLRSTACIMVLDDDSGSATFGQYVVLSMIDGPDAISGLAVHPTNGKIYTFESDSGGTLFELDPITGDTTVVLTGLNEGSSGKGTTFTANGLLYVFGADKLTEIDIGAGTNTEVGRWTLTGFPTLVDASPTIGSMATRDDGTVFGIFKDGGGGGSTTTTYLVTVDVSTAEVTMVGANTNRLDGLAYIPTRLVN